MTRSLIALTALIAACGPATELDEAAPVERALTSLRPLSGYPNLPGWDRTHLWSIHVAGPGWSDIQLGDVNGDGLDDLCGFFGDVFGCSLAGRESFFGWVEVLESYGLRGTPWAGTARVVDVNGDGKAEVCGRTAIGVLCSVWDPRLIAFAPYALGSMTTTYTNNQRDVLVADFSDANAWSRPEYQSTIAYPRLQYRFAGPRDVCARGAAGITCWYHDLATRRTTRGPSAPEFSDAAGWNKPQHYSTIRFVDVTGDGHDDVCGRGYDGIVCAVYDPAGRRFLPATLWTTSFRDATGWTNPIYYSSLRFADVNGDGRADVCGRGTAGVHCALADAQHRFLLAPAPVVPAFSDVAGWNQSPQYHASLMLEDLDGDGRADACGVGPHRQPDGSTRAEVFCTYSTSTATAASFGANPFRRTTASGFAGPVRAGRIRGRVKPSILGEFCGTWASGDVVCTNVQ